MNPKLFYSNYIADDNLCNLNLRLIKEVESLSPVHVFEMGCGTGKNLIELHKKGIVAHGLDISAGNVCTAIYKHGLPFVAIGNDSHLRHYANFDVCFTCSFLDHVENAFEIVGELKRICNKAVILAEPQHHSPETLYWAHKYEDWGFEKLDYQYKSPADGNTYFLYKWIKQDESCVGSED